MDPSTDNVRVQIDQTETIVMSDLFKLFLRSVAIGLCLAAIFVAMILWFDIAGLQSLMLGGAAGLYGLAALWVLNGIVFGAVQFAIAVMGLSDDEGDDDDKRGGHPIGRIQEQMIAIPVPVDSASKRPSSKRR
jgi:hypothetical protein